MILKRVFSAFLKCFQMSFALQQIWHAQKNKMRFFYVLSPGQTIATSQRNISQHCWPSICKLRPNDRNIRTKQIATLLSATYYTRLAVATCCELKIELVWMLTRNIIARSWPNDYNIMQHPQMLHGKFYHFQIWANNTQHVATSRNRMAKGTQHVAPNNVAICCVETFRSFGPGFILWWKWDFGQSEHAQGPIYIIKSNQIFFAFWMCKIAKKLPRVQFVINRYEWFSKFSKLHEPKGSCNLRIFKITSTS